MEFYSLYDFLTLTQRSTAPLLYSEGSMLTVRWLLNVAGVMITYEYPGHEAFCIFSTEAITSTLSTQRLRTT